MQQQTLTTSPNYSPKASANCFFLNGKLEEGILIDFNHPLPSGRPALILGQHSYVLRDNCIVHVRDDGRGYVDRAMLGEMETQGGKKFPRLSKADHATTKKLVHVDYSMPAGAKLASGFEPLWAGVGGMGEAGRIVAHDTNEALVEMDEDDVLFVFYQDGSVVRVNYNDFGSKRAGTRLAPEDALDVRIDHARDWLTRAATGENELSRAKAHDRALHEFAAMLRMTKIFPKFGKKIVHTLDSVAANGCAFRPGVRAHFKTVFNILGDRTIYSWLADETANEVADNKTAFIEPPKKCDGRLHGLITEAMEGRGTWETAYNALVAVAAQSNLRFGVQKRFTLQCPAEKSVLSDKVAKLPLAPVQQTNASPSPLGRGDQPLTPQEKLQAEATRSARRAERHAAQPTRGASSGTKKQSGDKKK